MNKFREFVTDVPIVFTVSMGIPEISLFPFSQRLKVQVFSNQVLENGMF